MVYFKEVIVSRKIFLVILDDERQSVEKGTRLNAYESLIGEHAAEWPRLTNPFHKSSWSREVSLSKMTKVWTLQSAHNQATNEVDRLPTLGRRIIEGKATWEDNIAFTGEFRHFRGYWEWTEDVLSRCGNSLRALDIYAPIYASLFTYDRNVEIVKAFCEAWCPLTNTLLTSSGELSISLWDLHALSGLPLTGTLYDEHVPRVDALVGVDKRKNLYVPPSCKYLFHAFHLLRGEADRPPHYTVSVEDWINFWSRRSSRYRAPPSRKEKKGARSKQTHNPPGVFKDHEEWTFAEKIPFVELHVREKQRCETYLAAYLVCWLCTFVLPEGDGNSIRPSVFKIASIMASGEKVALTVPVLASIYRGLNKISSLSKPPQGQAAFPVHFVYSWMACYFKTHFILEGKVGDPRMVQYSGEGGARSYDFVKARERICKGDFISWNCTIPPKKHDVMYIDDENASDLDHGFFMAVRSNFLARRLDDRFLVEPYSPHRFSRQFGYYQMVPGVLAKDVREASLADGLKYWRVCLLHKSFSKACFPCFPSSMKKSCTIDYKKWWDQVYDGLFEKCISFLTRRAGDISQDKEEDGGANPSNNGKRKIDVEASASSNVERHWKRQKNDQEASKLTEGVGGSNVSTQEMVKEIFGTSDQDDSQDSHGSTMNFNASIEVCDSDKHPEAEHLSQVEAISKFNGKALFDDRCKPFLKVYWNDLREKLMKTSVDSLSSIRDEALEGLSLMKNTPHSFDLSHLTKSLEILFTNAAAYDEARSKSFESGSASTQRVKEVQICIRDAKAQEDEESRHIESIRNELDELEKRKKELSMSLKGHIGSHQAIQDKVHGFEQELSKIKHSLDGEVAEKLKNSKSLLESARRALEDQNPFA